jgi:UDP-galactose transporter B1
MNPGNTDLLVKIGMFSVMSAVGQNFIFLTLEKFDALILTTVTTTRKCFTVAVSVVYYGHELSATQYGGIALVVAGLGLELYGKYTKSQAQKTSTGEASKKAV